jgi:hypothetical protein
MFSIWSLAGIGQLQVEPFVGCHEQMPLAASAGVPLSTAV